MGSIENGNNPNFIRKRAVEVAAIGAAVVGVLTGCGETTPGLGNDNYHDRLSRAVHGEEVDEQSIALHLTESSQDSVESVHASALVASNPDGTPLPRALTIEGASDSRGGITADGYLKAVAAGGVLALGGASLAAWMSHGRIGKND